jgi:Fe-S cluster biosynthesis and repair protein YggX
MSRTVHCAKLGQSLPGISYRPFNNELGRRIYEGVSQKAWTMWVEFSKKIVNEYRLDLTTALGQGVLLEQAERFFFGDGGQAPPGAVPPDGSANPNNQGANADGMDRHEHR